MDEDRARILTLAISIAALAQPWVIAGWNRWVRRGRVEVFPSGDITVGFLPVGPSIRMFGILRAVHQEVFIRDLSLVVIRQQDNATHRLEWRFTNHGLQRLPNRQEVQLEFPAGIMLAPSQPQRFDITFADTETELNELSPLTEQLRRKWEDSYSTPFRDWHDANPSAPAEMAHSLMSKLSDAFVSTDEYRNAVDQISHLSYWDAGDYRLEFHVSESNEPFRLIREWKFKLLPEDARQVRANATQIAGMAVDRFIEPFHWASCKYREETDDAGQKELSANRMPERR